MQGLENTAAMHIYLGQASCHRKLQAPPDHRDPRTAARNAAGPGPGAISNHPSDGGTTMAQLIRNESFDDIFNNLFQGFVVRPVGAHGGSTPAGAARPFSVEVVEEEKAYAVHAELPGVARDDIHVTIDGNDVAISAEVKSQREAKAEGRVLRSERYYGKLYRAFQLADAIDETAAEAKYSDGVLELRLPKKAVTSAKRLEIR